MLFKKLNVKLDGGFVALNQENLKKSAEDFIQACRHIRFWGR
jgi:hypothetical protein